MSSWAKAGPTNRVVLCGAKTVSVYDPTTDDLSWQWQATDSPEIPTTAQALFRTTDECKPVGPYLLITSSSGGVALILRDTKRCAFYTRVQNAHSACLLPGMRIAVAASTGGDALLVFDRRKSGINVEPSLRLDLKGAHGVLWDAHSETCWALGTHELLELDRHLQLRQRHPLPSPGGHDLSTANKPGVLIVTTSTEVHEFDTQTHKFTPHPLLGSLAKVKSVDFHPKTGDLVYQQALPDEWWSRTIRFGKQGEKELPDQRLYKIRWDATANTPAQELANQFKKLGGNVFEDKRGRISEVNLNNQAITDDQLYRLAWLPYLTDLSLENTATGDDGIRHIAEMAHLEWLNLWQTHIGDNGLKHLANLTTLQHLPIGGTRITDAGLIALKNLNQLKYLGLRRTAITDAGIQGLNAHPLLEELNLSETAVTDACIPNITPLKKLKRLVITDSAISDAGFSQLRAALPNCLILR